MAMLQNISGILSWEITRHDDAPRLEPTSIDNEELAEIAVSLYYLDICNGQKTELVDSKYLKRISPWKIDWIDVCRQCDRDPDTYISINWNNYFLTAWGTHPHDGTCSLIELFVAVGTEKS